MKTPELLMTGIVFGEQPRWHDGRLRFSDWGRREVMAVAPDGASEVMHRGSSFPLCVDWLPDGRLLVVDTSTPRLLVQDADGSLETHAELGRARIRRPVTSSSSTAAATPTSAAAASA